MAGIVTESPFSRPLAAADSPAPDVGTAAAPFPSSHPTLAAWHSLLACIHQTLHALAAHPARSVVLLPYEQLLPLARQRWAQQFPAAFVPRFETTDTWAKSLWDFEPQSTDFVPKASARSLAQAASMLEGAGQGARRRRLAAPLLEAVSQLAPLAASVPPTLRGSWQEVVRATLLEGEGSLQRSAGGALEQEAVLAHIALAWAGNSDYASDALFAPKLRERLDALIIVPGLRRDELLNSLAEHYFEHVERIELLPLLLAAPESRPALHPCLDAGDEAERTAACVLRHIEAGRTPVALASGDGALLRRCTALLEVAGVRLGHELHDETGWPLSTTHAAAQVMALLTAACTPQLLAADAIAYLKLAPAVDANATAALEAWLRRCGVRHWPPPPGGSAGRHEGQQHAQLRTLPAAQHLDALRAAMPPDGAALHEWLHALRSALQSSGMWRQLAADAAGRRLIEALGLGEDALAQWRHLPAACAAMHSAAFTAWVAQALEEETFRPARSARILVEVLPLAQLFGRPFAALVLAGVDSDNLPAAPPPPGVWTRAQREALHLPLREEMHKAQRDAWALALRTPHIDLLWRRQGEREGEAALPSPLLQAWALAHAVRLDDAAQHAPEPRELRTLPAAPTASPAPSAPEGAALPWAPLTASSYEVLRACPYRFFVQRLLALAPEEELDDSGVPKKDWGTWLHAALEHFHKALERSPTPDAQARAALMDTAAEAATAALRLDAGGFLPFAAAWPALRDAYLAWLAAHEAGGWRFAAGEKSVRRACDGGLELAGRIDRIDHNASGAHFILDYKTGSQNELKQRTRDGAEDVQLPFYALLLDAAPSTRAAYLSLSVNKSEGEPQLFEYGSQPKGRGKNKTQRNPAELASLLRRRAAQLLAGMESDMQRIGAGAPLRSLGEGKACQWCEARGLCRRDWWTVAAETPAEPTA